MKLIESSLVDLVWQQLWQCSLLVLVVYLMCRLIKFRRAHLSFLLWLLVLLKFMTPPLWTSSSGLFCWVQVPFHSELRQEPVSQGPQSLTRTESIQLMTGGDLRKLPDVETKSSPFTVTIRDADPNESRDVPTDQRAMITQPAVTKLAVIKTERRSSGYTLLDLGLIVWALVALLILGVMGVRYWRCKRIIRHAGEQLHPELNQLLEWLCKELKVKRRVRLLITKSRMGPAVMGLFRPTIILPEVITDARSLKELEPILAHELIHIRRGDLWVGLLQLLASVVWWFNPLVWFSGRRLKFEIEQCCDEEVLAELNCVPGIYAKCLLEVLELKQSLKTVPVVPGVRPVEITSKRLERIMKLGHGCQKRTPWWYWMIFVGLAAVVLPGAAFMVTAAVPQSKVLPPSQAKEIVASQKMETDPIQSLPFYDELKQVANSNKHFRNMYSTDLDYLSPEIDIRDWISRMGRIRAHSIKELMEQTRKAVGPARAEQVLEKKLNARISEIRVIWATNHKSTYHNGAPLFFETVQVPLKDERMQGLMITYGGQCIRNDHLIVWAKDNQFHKEVEQALAELALEKITLLELNAKFITVPRSLLEKISSKRRNSKVFQLKQVPANAEGVKPEGLVSIGAETVSRPSLVNEVLDENRFNEVQRLIQLSASSQILSAPQVRFLDGQSVQFETKKRSVFKTKFKGAGQQFSLTNTDVGLAIDIKYTESKGIDKRGMLEYQIAYSEMDGRIKQKVPDQKTGQEKEVEVPLIRERHFKDASLMKPGQVLLAGGLELHEDTNEPKVLLAMFQLDEVEPVETGQMMHGVGVNSDAGVTGQIVIDEPKNQNTLITETYPVADLVIPLPRKVISSGYDTAERQARFEPLIELIKQNITPEDWEDAQNRGGYFIVPDEKTLSLIIRHTRNGHDQIIKLLEKLRAIQDTVFRINLSHIQTDDLQKSIKEWEPSKDPDVQSLLKQLKTKNLKDGIIISVQQAGLFRRIVDGQSPMTPKSPMTSIRLVNGQTGEVVVSDAPMRSQKSNSRVKVQVRPELLKDQKLRLSLAINPEDALDALSNLKNITLPKMKFDVFEIKGNFVLFDITDQVTGKEPAFLPYQQFNQVEQKSKNQKQLFLLVAPSVSSRKEFVERRPIPPKPIQPVTPQPAR